MLDEASALDLFAPCAILYVKLNCLAFASGLIDQAVSVSEADQILPISEFLDLAVRVFHPSAGRVDGLPQPCVG